MSVLDRSALVESPLADLHAVAQELSIDGYRRLRRPELITAILEKQGGDAGDAGDTASASGPADTDAPPKRTRSRRPKKADATEAETEAEADEATTDAVAEPEPEAEADESESEPDDAKSEDDDEDAEPRRRRGRRGGRGRSAGREDADGDEAPKESARKSPKQDAPADDKPARRSRRSRTEPESESDESTSAGEDEPVVEGVVELLANGSGFVRVDPPEPSDEDVYISSAQVKRCELVSGDRIAGPKRAPRRSERFASLIRIESINGRPASELADSIRFDDLPVAMPSERLKVGSDDPTLKAIEWLTPFGKGSRVTIVGAARAGKSEALRRLAGALAGREELTLSIALAGVRPEELSEWAQGPITPAAGVSFAASEDAQNGVIEPVIDQARRLAARGADAVVLIDSLDGCSPSIARKALASARNIVDGGSVTVIATAAAPIGGETTVISLDVALASIGRFPALDLLTSGTLRPELLVGEAGAEAIARTRAEVSEPAED
jgi:transcription termination factor Rho